MEKNILPIGSVVKIKDLEKKVMIFGYLQKCGVEHVKTVDYVGVPYPEGNIGPYAQIGFQRYDIDEFLPWAERIVLYGSKEVGETNGN